jgi:diadenylate cyclase
MGLRHRAAIGVTETTDAIAMVVSEETGNISLVEGGNLMRRLSKESLTQHLSNFLADNDQEPSSKT